MVLNLVINGWPSIPSTAIDDMKDFTDVLNLVINGWPSIQKRSNFKIGQFLVLNLVINGWPSILFLFREQIAMWKF